MLAVAAILGASSSEVRAATLLSHYTFAGNADNQVSGAPDGTIAGAAGTVGFTAGPVDINPDITTAIQFTSTSADNFGYVDLGTASPPFGGAGLPIAGTAASGSVALWILSTQTAQGAILGTTSAEATGLFQLAANADGAARLGVSFRDTDGTLQTGFNTDLTYRNGEWNHYAITWTIDEGSLATEFYLNGSLLSEGNGSTTAGGGNEILNADFDDDWDFPLLLGTMNNRGTPLGNRYFVGSVADLRIYEGALTSDEVLAIYTIPEPAGLPFFGLAAGALLLALRRPHRQS